MSHCFKFYNYENNQQDALHRLIYYSRSALHVSGDDFAHHQKHLTVFTVYGSVHPSCCRLVPAATWVRCCWLQLLVNLMSHGFKIYNYENNQQDALYRLIYYSRSALHVSGDVFAHHQEHLAVFTVYGSVHPSCCRHQPAATWVNTTIYCKHSQVLLMMGENIARNM